MSLSLPQTHSNNSKAFGSDISDAMKQIIGKVGKKKNINGSVAMALEEQSYLVQLMIDTKRDTGSVEFCQTVLENFRRTLRSYGVQMEQVMGMNRVKVSDERFMVVMTKQRTLEIEIRYLESKIDLMQRRNRIFDEFAERLSALYNTGWPKIPSVPPQNVFEKNIEEIYKELHKAEMLLERYTFLHTILLQGSKVLDAAEGFMNRFQNAQDMNLLKATRLCTIQADVLIKQAKYIFPSLLNNQLNAVIFRDGWLSAIFRSDAVEDSPQMIDFLSTQHAALVPFIDEAHHLVESQTEAVNRLRDKYHSAILDKENAQRKLLYDTIKGENADGIQEILSLTYDMSSDLDGVIVYNNNDSNMTPVLGNENVEAFFINDDADSQGHNVIGPPNEIPQTPPSVDSAIPGTRAEPASGSDTIVIPSRPSLEDPDSLFLRPESNSGSGSGSRSRSRSPSNLSRYNTIAVSSRLPSPAPMSRQREEMTTTLQPSVPISTRRGRTSPAPLGRTSPTSLGRLSPAPPGRLSPATPGHTSPALPGRLSPVPPRPTRAPTLDIDDIYDCDTPIAQRAVLSTEGLNIVKRQNLKPPPYHSPSPSLSDTSFLSRQQQQQQRPQQQQQLDPRRNELFRSTSERPKKEDSTSSRGPSPLPFPAIAGHAPSSSYPQQQSSMRPLPPYQNGANANTRGPSPQPQPQPGHSPRPSFSQQQPSQPTPRTLPVPRQGHRTLPTPPSKSSIPLSTPPHSAPPPSRSPIPSPAPQPQPQPQSRSPLAQPAQPDALSSQPQRLALHSAPPTLEGRTSSPRIPPPTLSSGLSIPNPPSPSSTPPAVPPKPKRGNTPDEKRPAQCQQHLDTIVTQSLPLSCQSSLSPLQSSPTTTAKPPRHGIMKQPTTTSPSTVSRPAPARQPSMDEWGGVKVATAAAPRTRFRSMFDKFRSDLGSTKRTGSFTDGSNRSAAASIPSVAAAAFTSTSTSTSASAPPKLNRRKPQFVDEVEYIPRPESDSYPLSDDEDEEDLDQPPSPSKRRDSLLLLSNPDNQYADEEEGEGSVDLDDYYSNDYSPTQKPPVAVDAKVPPHPGFPSFRESVMASPSDNHKLYMDEMFNPGDALILRPFAIVISPPGENKRAPPPPPLAQPKPLTIKTSNPLLSKNWHSPSSVVTSRDLTFS